MGVFESVKAKVSQIKVNVVQHKDKAAIAVVGASAALSPVSAFASSSTSSAADITTFTGFATQLLTWLITTMGTVLNFMLSNPICFVGLVLSLIVAAIGTLRHLVGG